MNIFPYEKIPNGASIVLHGYGRIGREIINQLTGNSFCSIVAVVDKRAEYIMDCPVPIYDLYTEILAKYEYVVIAVENPSVVEEIKKKWVKSGISEDRIVSVEKYDEKLTEKPYLIKETGSKYVTVGLWCTSGLGDAIIDYALACRIKKLLKSKCKVTLITQYSDLFDDLDYIDEVKNRSDATYDLFFHNMMIPIIEYWSPEKIQTYSNTLYEYCEKCILDLRGFNNSIDYLKYLTFGKLQGKKRSEMIDIYSILPLCTERQFIRLNDEDHDAVSRFGLKENNYIIVNRDVDQVQSMQHPKLWPLSHYNRLIEIIKQEYDELKVVQVGAKRKDNAIKNADLDLSGETTLKEVRALLYHSKFMISGEGGLVHLNNLLGKRAVVLYGPTDEDFFHYDEDIICVKRNGWCSIPCNYVRADYVDGCIKGGYPAGCMVDLKPEYVYDCIKAGGLL